MDHIQALARVNDRLIPALLSRQETDPGSAEYGALITPEKGYGEPGSSGNCADILLAAYYCPQSVYCGDNRLLAAAALYLDNLLRMQNEDGTLDLRETNFHDATYAAFTVQVLGYTWRLVERRAGDSELERAIQGKLRAFLERSARGMCAGGFHTPNHRWVLSSALALCAVILQDEECRAQVQLYLNEGIDCDENGEFTERSSGIYNVVNDRSLIIVARELEMPALLEHVRRNLSMMYCYIEPDFSVFTLNSRRQDHGKAVYPINYYDCYRFMAFLTGDSGFAWMADRILERLEQAALKAECPDEAFRNVGFCNALTHYLIEDALAAWEPIAEEPPQRYQRFFPGSGIARMRRGAMTLTVLGQNSTFCVVQKGHTKVHIRMAASFYAKGVFASPVIEPVEDGYALHYSYCWGYVRPLPGGSPTSVWAEMDHAARERVNMKTMEMRAVVRWPEGQGVSVELSVSGVENLPSRVELIFDAGGEFSTNDVVLDGAAGQSLVLRGDQAWYRCMGETFSLQTSGTGPPHTYTYQMRGGEPRRDGAFTVYLTGMGETVRTIRIQ